MSEQLCCPICGKDTKGKEVCLDCYKEIMQKQDEIDKNLKPYELKDYFYALNNSIYRVKEHKYAIGQIYKLYAIAWILKYLHKDEQLSDVVTNYTKKIINTRKEYREVKITEEKEKNDKSIVAIANQKNRTSDGHICKSDAEVKIDDILYQFQICHAYGLKVKEIPTINERTVIADWYIPLQGTDGIYIEYWGMDKQDYQDNKDEKLKLYKKYNVKLLEINKNDIKDIQTLKDNIYQGLVSLGWKSK